MQVKDNFNTLLVVAYKFNDILYAKMTDEYNSCTHKKLLIIHKNSSPSDYPFLDDFNEVYSFKMEDSLNFFYKNIFHIFCLSKKIRCDVMFVGNPNLTNIRLIVHHAKPSKIFVVEDGSLNYWPYEKFVLTKSRVLKKTIEKLCGINVKKIEQSIQATYLLCPELGVRYWGEKRKIDFSNSRIVNSIDLSFLKNKRIFIGNSLYLKKVCSIDEYNMKVNNLIQKYQIDYYIPHWQASKSEKIDAEILDLNRYKVTLEMIATNHTFKIFSFGSSSLYTTKLINPRIETYLIKGYMDELMTLPLYQRTIDNYIS